MNKSIFIKIIILVFIFSCSSEKKALKHTDFSYHRIDSCNVKYNNLNKYDIFILGEIHLQKENVIPFTEFIKYMYRIYDIRNIVLEDGFSRGKIVNSFINSGDTTLFTFLKHYGYKEDLDFYLAIWQFNRKLPANKRLNIYGADYDEWAELSFVIEYLRTLTPNTTPPDSLKDIVNYIRITPKYDYFIYQENEVWLKKIEASLARNNSEYKSYYGANFPLFLKAIERWNSSKIFHKYDPNRGKDSAMFYKRETFIANHFREIVKSSHGEKIISIFGFAHIGHEHVLSNNKLKSRTFIYNLENDTTRSSKLKIASIGMVYHNYMNRRLIRDEFPFKIKPIYKSFITKPGIYLVEPIIKDSTIQEFIKNKMQYMLIYRN